MSSNSRKQKEKSNYPFTFNVIPETLESPFKELFPSYPEGLVQSEPGNFVYHPLYSKNADEFYNFPKRKDDVWIRTFPRSGTTWTSELTWLIMNDCNFEEANKIPLTIRSPNIDTCYATNLQSIASQGFSSTVPTLEKLADLPSPRVLKSHLAAYLLPPDLLDACKDIRKEIRKIGQFLNKQLTDEQIEKLVEHVKVDNFSKNKSVNLTMEIESGLINEGHSFVRKGTTQSPFKEHFPAYTDGLVQSNPGNFVYHPLYGANAKKFYDFPIRKDDVWIRTFPRSGTTWTSELAWLIMNDCNFEVANTIPLTVRAPNIDTCYCTNWEAKATDELKDALPTLDKMDFLTSPRVLKSHLPAYLLPPNLMDTCKDIRKEIKKIAAFLGKTVTPEQIEKLVDHVKVDNFSKNASTNKCKGLS
uniref:Sulfotransferase domain-containing protein n=1 Tax=Daphnia galeata TaxID=27404 RepID=A0A8J2RKQ2_9CRUS|nr:unnamed protein product [Daphnia galeata]